MRILIDGFSQQGILRFTGHISPHSVSCSTLLILDVLVLVLPETDLETRIQMEVVDFSGIPGNMNIEVKK